MSLLSVENICVEYKSFKLDNVSFDLNQGEIIGFVGRNGAGKSTTINAVIGLAKRSNGKVFYCGQDIDSTNIHILKQNIGYIGDFSDCYPNVRVRHLVGFVASLYDQWDKEKAAYYLNTLFKIDQGKAMKELSSGTRVKLGLAMALSHDAKILILDEPTSGLDPLVREEVLQILHDLVSTEGRSVFFSSHIIDDIRDVADKVMYIVDGKIRLSCRKDELSVHFTSIKSTDVPDKMLPHLNKSISRGGRLILARTDIPDEIEKDVNGFEKVTIEDVLIYLNGGISYDGAH
jgi:ABC-type multidrug transport system, ATPase component